MYINRVFAIDIIYARTGSKDDPLRAIIALPGDADSIGDWAAYLVDVPVAGTYSVDFRVSSSGVGGTVDMIAAVLSLAAPPFQSRVGGDFPVVDCTPTGVVCQPLQASKTAKGIQLQGRLGVFYKGDLVVKYLNASGEIIDAETVIAKVSPLKGVDLSHEVKAVSYTSSVVLHLYDKNGQNIGQLAKSAL